MRKYVDETFFDTWSPHMAYVLGFLMADGYVNINVRGSHYLGFTSTDKEIIGKIRSILQSEHRIGVRTRKGKYQHRKKAYTLQIGSKHMVMVLTSMYGVIPNKSLRIEFPTYIPRQHLKHLVRGYFDGDGGVVYVEYKRKNRNNTIGRAFHSRFTSGSRVFLKELHKQLQAAKIVTGGSLQVKPGGGFELAFAAYDSIALFEFMYKNVSYRYYLERKRNAFYNIIQLWN